MKFFGLLPASLRQADEGMMTEEGRNQARKMEQQFATGTGRHCPFVANPFEDCFVANIHSQNVDLAIYYCGNNFEDCEIYRSIVNKESS